MTYALLFFLYVTGMIVTSSYVYEVARFPPTHPWRWVLFVLFWPAAAVLTVIAVVIDTFDNS